MVRSRLSTAPESAHGMSTSESSKAHPGFRGGGSCGVISGVDSARWTDRCERRLGPQGRLTMVNIQALIDDAKCFETVRAMRRPDGVRCPGCGTAEVTGDGRED